MKTRKIILAFAVFALMGNVQLFAQNTNEVNKNKKIDMNALMEKRVQRMQEQLALDEATAAKFAPLYKEYMNALVQCRPATAKRERGAQCTDADRTKCIEMRMDCQEKMVDTQKEYYNKFKKFLNARQLEMVFNNHHRMYSGAKGNYGRRGYDCHKNAHKKHTQCDRRGCQHNCR